LLIPDLRQAQNPKQDRHFRASTGRVGTPTQLLAATPGLAADVRLRGTVIHERLVAEYGFTGSYQRVKMYVAAARPRICAELGLTEPSGSLHRRFETTPGAQAQVDWGTESRAVAQALGVRYVYSFHMVLSYSRDPFCCFTTSLDLGTFFGCHLRAFAHFGGVPGSIVYDRTKTVVRRHVAPGRAVPIHPEAAAFAEHHEFEADLARTRTREGMAVARSKGRLRGKQPKLSPSQEAHLVELYRAGGRTISELEELFSVTRSTIYRAVARAGDREA